MSNAIQRIIDDETGREMVYGYADEVSIQTNETLEDWREEKQRRKFISEGPTLNYVNCYHEPVAALNEVLEVNELGAIMKLIPYIKMHSDGALFYDGARMSIPLIGKAIDRSVRQTKTIVATLHKEGVLSREKVGRSYVYSVEAQYHTFGYVVKNSEFTKVLQIKTRTDIRNLSVQAAGVLYKMLPFFNYEHFYLCTAPNEADEERIYPLSHREFADMVSVNRSVIDSGVKELLRYGFMIKVSGFNGEVYVVNPDVATRRKNMFDKKSEMVRGLFRIAKIQGEGKATDIGESALPY